MISPRAAKKGNAENDLINMLKIEHKAAMKWFYDNKMNVNPDKFESIILAQMLSPYKNI